MDINVGVAKCMDVNVNVAHSQKVCSLLLTL